MKQTVTLSQFRDAFSSRPDNFSYEGLGVLYDYLTQLEDDCGIELELDVIGLCCDYSEDDLQYFMDQYDMSLEELRNNTTVLDVGMGQVIIQNF